MPPCSRGVADVDDGVLLLRGRVWQRRLAAHDVGGHDPRHAAGYCVRRDADQRAGDGAQPVEHACHPLQVRRYGRAVIGEDEAEGLLRRDVGIAERSVLRFISVPLTDGQFDALVSFAFNVGAGGLQRSTLRRKVNREEHALVPAEFLKWVWAGGRKLRGLVRRREAEARC